jgi:hypothetical protein
METGRLLSVGSARGFLRLEEEEENKPSDIERHALLGRTTHEAQHESKQGQRFA